MQSAVGVIWITITSSCKRHNKATAKKVMYLYGVKVSRWSVTYFVIALGSLLLAELLWATGIADPLAGLSTGWVLVAVHLTTIGWMTILMLGALQQFVPVLTTKELASQSLAGWTLGLLLVGLGFLLVGFLSLPSGIFFGALWTLPTGGTLIVVGVILALINMGITLGRAWPWAFHEWLIAGGLFFLFLTVSLGLTFTIGFSSPGALGPVVGPAVFGQGLVAHVVGGIVGWLTLTALGVSYKLLSMFTLAPEHRGFWGWAVLGLTGIGVLLAWTAQWGFWPWLNSIGWGLGWLGLAIFLVDMVRLYRQRKRRQMELNARAARWALWSLGLALVGVALVGLGHQWHRWVAGIVFLWLYGWLGGLGLTQLYKILPFLTWIERYGKKMGRQRTPRVQDLVNEARDEPAYAGYFVAVGTAAAGLVWGRDWLFRVGMWMALVATADIARALWKVRHGDEPDPETTGVPRPASPIKTEGGSKS